MEIKDMLQIIALLVVGLAIIVAVQRKKLFTTFFSRSALGIDVGNAQIKIVEVKGGTKPKLLRYSIVPTPRGSVENGIVKRPEELITALRQAVKIGKFSSRRCITVLTGQNLLIRHVELPPMPKKDLPAAIKWQFDQYFQLRPDETLTDYQVTMDKPGNPLAVMLVAMNREPVIGLVENLKQVGLMPQAVDIEPLAVLRTVRLCHTFEQNDETSAVVDFGAGTTNISVFKGGILQSARVIPIGGNHFTRAVMVSLGLDFAEAEAEKVAAGLRLDSPLAPVVASLRDQLFGEISRTLNFYLAEHREQMLSYIEILGGNSLMPGLQPQLESYLLEYANGLRPDFEVKTCNPLAYMQHELAEDQVRTLGATLSVAIGLALGEVQKA